jgi:hypothetical protein
MFKELFLEAQADSTNSVKGMIKISGKKNGLWDKQRIKEFYYDKKNNEFWNWDVFEDGTHLAIRNEGTLNDIKELVRKDDKSVKKLQPYKSQILSL